jgi:hypothetical protein
MRRGHRRVVLVVVADPGVHDLAVRDGAEAAVLAGAGEHELLDDVGVEDVVFEGVEGSGLPGVEDDGWLGAGVGELPVLDAVEANGAVAILQEEAIAGGVAVGLAVGAGNGGAFHGGHGFFIFGVVVEAEACGAASDF